VGRAGEIRTITAALVPKSGQVPVVGIEGLAGVGKTALAVHIGHAVAGDFPDGLLFADLGTDPLPGLLRDLGVTDLPASTAEQGAAWRTRTAGRRLLVVLDGARDADQLRHLIPGAGGAAVLITARRRLYGVPYVQWLPLSGLDEPEAHALFERLVGDRVRREPAVARELVAMTAGLPQVIAAIGSRIASRPEHATGSASRCPARRCRGRSAVRSRARTCPSWTS
jgi:predicted ATPase